MVDTDFKYKTKFVIKANIVDPSKEILDQAKASLNDLKSIFPQDIDPQTDPDLLYIIGNLAVAGVLNLNDDGLSIEESLSVFKKFEKKQVNLEHDRDKIVGFIVKSGLSEFGTDKPISEIEAKSQNKPFNITVVIALWKVASNAKDLCKFLLDNSNVNGNKDLSLSFEVGFDAYQIIELMGDKSNFADAVKIIYPVSPEFSSYDACLKANDGSGKKNGNRVGRALCGRVLPLGAGIVTLPAAKVKGLLPVITKTSDDITKTSDDINDQSKSNPFSPPSNKPFDVPAKMKILKLSAKKIEDFNVKYPFVNPNDNKYLTVTLKSGKKIKLANYDKGYLELPKDEDFEEEEIISIDPNKVADQTMVDDSKVVHPRLDQQYPNTHEDTQKKEKEFQKQREELRQKAYKDASGQLLDLITRMEKTAERYFEQNPIKNGVLKVTKHNNIMNIDKLKEIKATVEKSEDPVVLKEAVANTALFAEELAKKSELMEAAFADHKKLMEDALKQKDESEKMHEAVKKELEALKTKLQDMENTHKASEAERKFNARMSKLDAEYDMDESCRALISKDLKDMSDEDYANYEMKLGALMKEKSKTYKNELAEKLLRASKGLKANIETHKDHGLHKDVTKVGDPKDKKPEAKDSDDKEGKNDEEDYEAFKKKVGENYPELKDESMLKALFKASKKMEDEEDEEDEAEANLIQALASANENPVDPLFNVTDAAKIPSLKELLKQSFGSDIKIAGQTVSELDAVRAKRLE